MKNLFKVLFVSTMIVSLTGCSDDNNGTIDNDPVVGKWEHKKNYIVYSDGSIISETNEGACDGNVDVWIKSTGDAAFYNYTTDCTIEQINERIWELDEENKIVFSTDGDTDIPPVVRYNVTVNGDIMTWEFPDNENTFRQEYSKL